MCISRMKNLHYVINLLESYEKPSFFIKIEIKTNEFITHGGMLYFFSPCKFYLQLFCKLIFCCDLFRFSTKSHLDLLQHGYITTNNNVSKIIFSYDIHN